MGYLPDPYRTPGVGLSKKDEKALARQLGLTTAELIAVDHVQLIERAKMRVLDAVAQDGMEAVIHLGSEVARCVDQNAIAAPLAADFAANAEREFVRRLKRTNERLG